MKGNTLSWYRLPMICIFETTVDGKYMTIGCRLSFYMAHHCTDSCYIIASRYFQTRSQEQSAITRWRYFTSTTNYTLGFNDMKPLSASLALFERNQMSGHVLPRFCVFRSSKLEQAVKQTQFDNDKHELKMKQWHTIECYNVNCIRVYHI